MLGTFAGGESMPQTGPGPRQSAWLVLAMLGMVAVPAAITLHTVRTPGVLEIASSNPTPYGYTWSLLLFIVPIAAIAGWFLPSEHLPVPKRAFWWTIGILVPLGFALDFFFANRFFVYPNAGATLRVGAPALGGDVPVEEYIFYFTGFLAVLFLYVWLSEYWLAAYSPADDAPPVRGPWGVIGFHPASAIAGVLLIAAAALYKRLLSPAPQGFPGYFTFIVLGALVPSAMLFPTARRRINWRALSATMFVIVLISLIWEATLAVPYRWWGFQADQMAGVFIRAWAGLPAEEIVVWVAVTWATVILYETMKAAQAAARSTQPTQSRPTAVSS
jgi:hypothetical protein